MTDKGHVRHSLRSGLTSLSSDKAAAAAANAHTQSAIPVPPNFARSFGEHARCMRFPPSHPSILPQVQRAVPAQLFFVLEREK